MITDAADRSPPTRPSHPDRSSRELWIALALTLAVLATFGGAVRNGFVNFDDGEYVYQNAQVRAGLSAEGVAWAFTTRHAFNWHPLTWLSHLLDVELFGLAAGGHHATSVLLHAASTAVLFLALHGLTGATWRSAFAAALFGLHPLRVESVAWAAERKDVLALLCGTLVLLQYARFARRPKPWRMVGVATLFALGLLAKPVLVTLPFALLLVDAWPLGRLRDPELGATLARRLARLVLEKLPLFLLSAASCAMTLLAQSPQAATTLMRDLPLGVRLEVAVSAVGFYLEKTVLPTGLAVFYPHPWLLGESVSTGRVAACLALVVAISIFAFVERRRRPWWAFGWLWFLGTLAPMLGFVQVGYQMAADRYTYLPTIGLAVALAWQGGELAMRWPQLRRAIATAGIVALALAALLTERQVRRWRGPVALYTHSVAATERNWLAWNNLAVHHLERGELPAALTGFERAAAAWPGLAQAWLGQGVVLNRLGRHAEAVQPLRRAASATPDDPLPLIALGHSLAHLERGAEALPILERASGLGPRDPQALAQLAGAYRRLGRSDRAAEIEARALTSAPPTGSEPGTLHP